VPENLNNLAAVPQTIGMYSEAPFGHIIAELAGKYIAGGFRAVMVPPDTPLFCFYCHDTEAPEYRLRRKGGKYVALCHRPGTVEGCWDRDVAPMCEYKDHEGIQCDHVAEWRVAFGHDLLMSTHRCLIHVPPALSDVSEHRVFPI
jgi:hypothetical protein